MIAERPRISIAGRRIFSAKVIRSTEKANHFSVTIAEDRTAAVIDFLYLEHSQGGVIEILTDCMDEEDPKC